MKLKLRSTSVSLLYTLYLSEQYNSAVYVVLCDHTKYSVYVIGTVSYKRGHPVMRNVRFRHYRSDELRTWCKWHHRRRSITFHVRPRQVRKELETTASALLLPLYKFLFDSLILLFRSANNIYYFFVDNFPFHEPRSVGNFNHNHST